MIKTILRWLVIGLRHSSAGWGCAVWIMPSPDVAPLVVPCRGEVRRGVRQLEQFLAGEAARATPA